MVTRYAEVCDGLVQNVILWDGDTETWQPPQGCVMVPLADDQAVSTGDLFDGNVFTSGEQPVLPAQAFTVEVDPVELAQLLVEASKATTVAATRTVLAALIEQLTPSE